MRPDLFSGIEPMDGGGCVRRAVAAVVDRASRDGLLSRRWSLAELRCTERDYDWLRQWAGGISGSTAAMIEKWRSEEVAGRPFSTATLFATLFLLVCTEHGRRHATSGELWRTVRGAGFTGCTVEVLFGRQHLRPDLCDGIEIGAGTNLKLRHVFGSGDRLQAYFDTIYLQFGFGKRGADLRLAEWLAGYGVPQSVRRLLDGELRSESFAVVWSALKQFRCGLVSEAATRGILLDSPWVLPTWADDLLSSAVRRPELGTFAVDTTTAAEPAFLATPLARWDIREGPIFHTRVAAIDHLAPEGTKYAIRLNGDDAGQLLRQPNGSYAFEPNDRFVAADAANPLQLPCSPTVVAELVQQDDRVVAAQTLQLWDPQDEVTAYRVAPAPGAVDAWNDALATGSEYILVVSHDLSIRPATQSKRIGTGLARAAYLERGWPREIEITTPCGQTLWRPAISGAALRSAVATPLATAKLQCDTTPVRWGSRCRVSVEHESRSVVRSLRVAGRQLRVERSIASSALSEPFEWNPELASCELGVSVSFDCDGSGPASVRLRAHAEFNGAAIHEQGRLRELHPEATEDKAALSRLPVRIWTGSQGLRPGAVYIEGGRRVDRPSLNGPRPIRDLAGFGGPLVLRASEFGPAVSEWRMVGAVVDHGIVAGFEEDRAGAVLRLRVNRAVEPSAEHWVVLWDADGRVGRRGITRCQLLDAGAEWRSELPLNARRIIACGVSFNGEWMGSAWVPDWANELQDIAADRAPKSLAVMRWLHLPIVEPGALAAVRSVSWRYADMALYAWLVASTATRSLVHADRDERWLDAVRAVFLDFDPNAQQALDVFDRLSASSGELTERQKIYRAAVRLCRLDPGLMTRLLERNVQAVQGDSAGPANAARTAELVAACFAGLRSDKELKRRDAVQRATDELIEEAARQMRVDDRFVRGILDRAVEKRGVTADPNLRLALSYVPFRHAYAVLLLQAARQRVQTCRS